MGLGVHRTFEISLPFPTPSQFVPRCMASARLLPDVPSPAVLSNSFLAAGVNKPGCRIVASPFSRRFSVVGAPDNREALARRERDAEDASLCATFSRAVGGGKWKGVVGAGISSAGSDGRTRGVPEIVPQVISLFTAAGPNCDGVGDGTDGSNGSADVFEVLTSKVMLRKQVQ